MPVYGERGLSQGTGALVAQCEELRAFLNEEANEAELLRARLLTDFTDAMVGALGEFVRNSNASQPTR
jgi:hypothetical protein